MLTDPINVITLIILVLSALFFVNVISCAYALGRFHAWLKERGEVFGTTAPQTLRHEPSIFLEEEE